MTEDWDKVYQDGYDSFLSGIESNENPYPYPDNDDCGSLYNAWQAGWITACNDSCELDHGYYL